MKLPIDQKYIQKNMHPKCKAMDKYNHSNIYFLFSIFSFQDCLVRHSCSWLQLTTHTQGANQNGSAFNCFFYCQQWPMDGARAQNSSAGTATDDGWRLSPVAHLMHCEDCSINPLCTCSLLRERNANILDWSLLFIYLFIFTSGSGGSFMFPAGNPVRRDVTFPSR